MYVYVYRNLMEYIHTYVFDYNCIYIYIHEYRERDYRMQYVGGVRKDSFVSKPVPFCQALPALSNVFSSESGTVFEAFRALNKLFWYPKKFIHPFNTQGMYHTLYSIACHD